MNKRNYQSELDRIIQENEKEGIKPKLLLHVCCAPCSSYCLLFLTRHFEIITDFYNPNIYPGEEYDKRASEFKRFVKALSDENKLENGVDVKIADYNPGEFFEIARGLEDIPEGGERCFKCYRLRLEHAAKIAKEVGADYFTTTLSISPLKNAEKINEIGEQLSKIYGVKHLPSDFKKKEGYKQSVALSSEYELYRQNYCGCVYSK